MRFVYVLCEQLNVST